MEEDTGQLELRQLLDEFVIAIELSQHAQVSSLASDICRKLTELYDNQLESAQNSRDDSVEFEWSPNSCSWRSIDQICKKLRQKAQLASAYGDVTDFVRVRDLVCLAGLFDTSRVQDAVRSTISPIDVDTLERVLRKTIFLLRYLDRQELEDETWISRSHINSTLSVGFARHTIHLSDSEKVVDDLLSRENKDTFMEKILYSEWLREFLSNSVEQNHPIDRFTLLVAIWMIGVECDHPTIGQLMEELIGQIYHEEASGCNQEDLMQLTQVGSFWLSYHRNYRANGCKSLSHEQREFDSIDDDDGDDDYYYDEDDYEHRLSSSAGDDSEASTRSGADFSNHSDVRRRLRKLIDDELLVGVRCILCARQPNQLLEPIKGSPDSSCPICRRKVFWSQCGISFKPLYLLPISCLETQKLELISPSEWVRSALLAIGFCEPNSSETRGTKLSERVDIGENFERLTVIDGDEDEDNDDAQSNKEDTEYPISPDSSSLSDYKTILNKFMRERKPSTDPTSASLQLYKYAKGYQLSLSPVFSSDFVLVDALDFANEDEKLLRVRLAATLEASNLSSGCLWICSARSPVSQLMIGCNRMFTSLELIRQSGSSNEKQNQVNQSEFTCPFCNQYLTEILQLIKGLGTSK